MANGDNEAKCPTCERPLQSIVKFRSGRLMNCPDHGLIDEDANGKLTFIFHSKKAEVAVPAEKDIRDEIVPALKKELIAKLEESEKTLGKKVKFFEREDLGAVGGGMDPSGIIYLLKANKRAEAIIGEEIMHLDWRTNGRPWMNPLEPAKDYKSAIKQISGHFEEFAFFAFLENDLKLNPRAFVNAIMPTTARRLGLEIYHLEGVEESEALRATFAALFVQARLMTNENAGAPVLAVFDRQMILAPYAKVGQLVCDEIIAAQKEDDAGITARMERTLFEHLKVPNDAVEVKQGL